MVSGLGLSASPVEDFGVLDLCMVEVLCLPGAGSMSVVEFELRPRLGRLRLFEISRLGFAFFRINVGAGPCIEALQRGASRQNTRVC